MFPFYLEEENNLDKGIITYTSHRESYTEFIKGSHTLPNFLIQQ